MANRKYDFLYNPETYKDIPCQLNCPVHTDVEQYIHLIAKGRWADAHNLIRETNPFPSVCGRVCQHPCEDGCNRQMLDQSVSIRTLKRAATDYSYDEVAPPKKQYQTLEKVAVIGAGPAGLTAANDLARLGYQVTVFEAEAHPGGMLRYGIPAYRLPREVIDRETDHVVASGVDIRYNTRVGRDIKLNDIRSEFKATLMAAGAWDPAMLDIPGEDLEGVFHGAPFMIKVNKGESVPMNGKKVLVVGGGFTAMDCSRSAIRLGAEEVHIVYRRTRDEIPVIEQEIIDAEAEGVQFQYLVAPLEIVADEDGKKAIGMKCVKNQLGEPDASGRRRPVPIEGSEFIIDCDIIVPAVSQVPNNDCLDGADDVARNKWGNIDADLKTCVTSAPDVFACGDYPVGTTHAIKVISEGHAAAVAIDTFLRGEPAEYAEKVRDDYTLLDFDEPTDKTLYYDEISRQHDGFIDIDKRVNTFLEVETGFTREAAQREATRCFQCNHIWTYIPETCIMCANCVDVCPQECLTITPLTELQHNRWLNEGIGLEKQGITGIEINIDLCIRCAFCKDVCPTDSITFSCYSDKPRAEKMPI